MVKSLKRNFITVLLLACVIFSLTLPTLAYDINTPGEVEPTIYNRTKWIATEVMQPIKDVVESFTGVYTGIADGLYDAYLEVFKNGGTDQQGNVAVGAVPITDSSGWVWYPFTNGKFTPSSNLNTSSEIRTVTSSDVLYSYRAQRSNASGQQIQYSVAANIFPSEPGTYQFYLDCTSSGIDQNRVFVKYGDSNASGSYQQIKQGFQFDVSYRTNWYLTLQWILNPNAVSPDWSNMWFAASAYIVKIAGPDMAAVGGFTGFGGGQTRGGGAGRRYDLIPASKADGVAVGSGVSRDDVLVDYALFDEDSKTVSIPQADGTTVNYTANTWVYNYETRTYNITTTNSTTVYITYGDDKATVTDGTNPPVDYYYTVPVAPDGGGGDDGGDDDGDGGFWDTILGGLADSILGFFKAVGVVAAAIFEGLVNLLTDAVASIGQLVALVGSLGAVVGGFFAFLPVEVQAAVSAGLIVVITFSVISVLRK